MMSFSYSAPLSTTPTQPAFLMGRSRHHAPQWHSVCVIGQGKPQAVRLAPSPCYSNEPGCYGGLGQADLLQGLAALEEDKAAQPLLLTGCPQLSAPPGTLAAMQAFAA